MNGQGSFPPFTQVHPAARSIILTCSLLGAGIALLVAPIPFASWPGLMIIEISMVYALTRLYNYPISIFTWVILVGGLLGLSAVVSLVMSALLEVLVLINLVLKPIVAAAIIWGLGELVILVLDRQSVKSGHTSLTH